MNEFERVGEKTPAKETDNLSGESDDLRKKGHRKDKIYHQQSNQISPQHTLKKSTTICENNSAPTTPIKK